MLSNKKMMFWQVSPQSSRLILVPYLNFRAIASLGEQRILNENHSFHDRVDLLLKHIG
jgi:tryptophan-rich sensory protein